MDRKERKKQILSMMNDVMSYKDKDKEEFEEELNGYMIKFRFNESSIPQVKFVLFVYYILILHCTCFVFILIN